MRGVLALGFFGAAALAASSAAAGSLVTKTIAFADPALQRFGLTSRYYQLSDDRALCAAQQTPLLIIALHGGQGSSQSMADMTGLHLARQCAIVVYPNGTRYTKGVADVRSGPAAWNTYGGRGDSFAEAAGVNDAGFIRALAESLVATYRLPRRVYLTGLSNGGAAAYAIACQMPDLVAALAPVSTTLRALPEYCGGPTLPVPLHHVHGMADTVIPWDGGGNLTPAVEPGIDLWAAANGCEEATLHYGLVQFGGHAYTNCAQPVTYNLIAMMGHAWSTDNFNTTAQLFAFFAEYR